MNVTHSTAEILIYGEQDAAPDPMRVAAQAERNSRKEVPSGGVTEGTLTLPPKAAAPTLSGYCIPDFFAHSISTT